MAVSMHWKLLAAAAAFSALAFGACGDEKSDDGDNKLDAGGSDAGGGTAIPIADLDDGVAGKLCATDADCGGKNANCNIAAGQTMGSCTGFCSTSDQCGAGGKCVTISALGQTGGTCQKACSSDTECSTGQECRAGIDLGSIISGLTDGGGIGVDAAVDMSSTCQVKPVTVQLADGVAGKACTGDTACGAGRCMTEYKITLPIVGTIFTQAFPGGYCTGDCVENAECGAGAGCFGAAPQAGATGNCLKTCTEHTECRAEHACTSFGRPGQTTSTKYCVPGERTSPEAGVSDGGAQDAGVHDAATQDASAADAGGDAG